MLDLAMGQVLVMHMAGMFQRVRILSRVCIIIQLHRQLTPFMEQILMLEK
jgi:hypothetical protein